ncbi:MAG TPA: ATP-binding cassette domain-containing protein, partial [Ramlibacter sp.]|nr:ATP-binding cassette domain-containing protein [Ramlibacter sp.]
MPEAINTGDTLLEVNDLQAWYGEGHVLHGMSLHARRGEVVTLLGRNGAGKTTTLKSIMGILRKRTGSVKFEGRELIAERAFHIARHGIALCPEERAIFSSLSVAENLELPPVVAPGGMTVAEIYELFPNLAERRAS